MMQARFAPGAIDERAERWLTALHRRTDPRSALAVADLLRTIDLRAEVTTLKVPLLILAPAESPFVPVSLAEDLHRAVPGSELRVFRGVRHGLPFSHASECANITLDFVTRHDGTSPP